MDDLFGDTFNLEDEIYNNAYKEGYADGITAGKIEGRTFGMAKGFDKFFESGRLFSKAVVLGTRLASGPDATSAAAKHEASPPSSAKANGALPVEDTSADTQASVLPALPPNARLEKNVVALYDLMEPETLSTDNSDEAVNDFDDRLKRAQGKAKIIDRTMGVTSRPRESTAPSS
ncbi:hypothetical protein BROUX41_000234 [Berkeleyomyces rouxiae]